MSIKDYASTPDNLPVPVDDGATDHVVGMSLPVFHVAGMQLIKRLTLVALDRKVVAVKYPVFPSNSDTPWVLDWLGKQH